MRKTLAIILSTVLMLGSLTVYGAASNNEDGDIVDDLWAGMYTTETIADLVLPGMEKPTEKETKEAEVQNNTTNDSETLGKTKIKKASKKISAKKVKVSIKKVKNAVGYQLQFSTTKKLKKIVAKKTINKTKTYIKSKKIKNKKKLYVRARAYKLDGNDKVYGIWSKVKKVKIRK